ncbi:phage terminase large subunit [Capnocytophaga granulosa]|uniref:phage terminase large subunit n=2 Tax=Capnocytophaga granulosa TaxID=45242 RepID=UPI0028F07224|nr:phage terminase large subunit [Capnocytophaga granulosa]
MEEALEILWTYARREPLDSNGETIVPTINNSIAAIRIIMRLEGWAMGSEKRKVNSEKRATHNKPASHRRREWQFAQHNTTNNDSPQSAQPHSAQSQFVQSQNAQPQYAQSDTDNNNDDDNYNYDKHDDEYTDGELPNMGELLTYSALADFAPTPAQHQYPQPNISHNSYHTAGASLQLVPQENLLSFTRHTLPAFAPAPFHIAYYEVLTRFAMGEIKKLMITMPPQHGKSEGATRRLPAFVLGQDPDKRIAIVSYNAIKARKFNRELQRIMDDDRYYELFPQTLLAGQASYQEQGRRSRNYARNSDECEIVGYQGSFKTIGVGGSLTGEPVDMLIMDDLYKDASSAWSPVIRQNVADWYDTVASTRLHNDSQQLLVFTRWHMEDLAGRLLEQEGVYDPIENPQGWLLVSFPAIQNRPPSEQDPRAEGEPLWPERHSLEKLLEIKGRSPTVFESLYQQNPQPSQGLMYEEFTCYTDLPSRSYSVAYIDAADSGADYLCALFYKEAEDGNYITDVLYTKDPMEVTETTLTYMLQQHQVERCHIESNNGGNLFVSNLQQRSWDTGNRLTRFNPFHQNQNKTARIFAASASVQKLIKMPLDWKKRFPKFARDLTGYLRVGTNAHDDAPDALTGSIECRQPPKRVSVAEMFGLR